MQHGSAQAGAVDPQSKLEFRYVAASVMAVIAIAATVSLYAFYKIDLIRKNLEAINQVYVPVLKHLNVYAGKWYSYQRSVEQAVSFRKWGQKMQQEDAATPKLRLKRSVEPNLYELSRALQHPVFSKFPRDREELERFIKVSRDFLQAEPYNLAGLTELLRTKRYKDAAAQYTRIRQQHLMVSDALKAVNRSAEGRIATLQLSAEDEMRTSQGIVLGLLSASLLACLFVLVRLRRWFLPVLEWTRVAQEIAMKGIHAGVRFPKVTGAMPRELALLTREFTRMGRTVLERELTIQQQKDKLESLNWRLKEQNERLLKLGSLNERVLNSMNPGLLVLTRAKNGSLSVEQFNDRYCSLFGFKAKELAAASADTALRVWPEALRKVWLEPMLDSSSSLLRRVHFEERFFDIRVQDLTANAGRLLLFEDVTQIVKTEEKLAHAGKLVLAGNLSSQVSHELRNPLNSMSLQLEMLEEDLEAPVTETVANEPLLGRVRMVREQVERLDRMTQRYLDLGKGAAPISKSVVDVHELIQKCLHFLSAEIQSSQVQVRFEFAPGSPVIFGDADALSQVFFNLVRNGIEAMSGMGEEPRTLTVSTEIDEAQVRVRVRDSGGGVPSDLRERLFEPFVTNKPNGHGLGLSVSRQICLDHGGELTLVEPNAFEFRIPKETDRAAHPDC